MWVWTPPNHPLSVRPMPINGHLSRNGEHYRLPSHNLTKTIGHANQVPYLQVPNAAQIQVEASRNRKNGAGHSRSDRRLGDFSRNLSVII